MSDRPLCTQKNLNLLASKRLKINKSSLTYVIRLTERDFGTQASNLANVF